MVSSLNSYVVYYTGQFILQTKLLMEAALLLNVKKNIKGDNVLKCNNPLRQHLLSISITKTNAMRYYFNIDVCSISGRRALYNYMYIYCSFALQLNITKQMTHVKHSSLRQLMVFYEIQLPCANRNIILFFSFFVYKRLSLLFFKITITKTFVLILY